MSFDPDGARHRGVPWQRASTEALRRALVLYLVVWFLPWPLTYLPSIGPRLDEVIASGWSAIASRLGIGSIDGGWLNGTAGDEIAKIVVAASAAVVVAAVSMLARPTKVLWLEQWSEPCTRFALATTLMAFGLNKVPPAQFSFPTLERLLQPVGTLNKMELMWTFIGASPEYQVFCGLMEISAALLLCVRRTRVAGALLATTVLAHVVVLDFCYDVFVKLYAAHLLVIAVGLCVPHAPRLLRFFAGQSVPADADLPPMGSPKMKRVRRVVVVAWFVCTSGSIASSVQRSYHQLGNARQRPALYGVFRVDHLIEDGRTRPALLDDDARWSMLVIDRALPMDFGAWGARAGEVWIFKVGGARERRLVELDDKGTRLTLLPASGVGAASEHLVFERVAAGWRATGDVDGHAIELQLTLLPLPGAALAGPTRSFDP